MSCRPLLTQCSIAIRLHSNIGLGSMFVICITKVTTRADRRLPDVNSVVFCLSHAADHFSASQAGTWITA